MKNEDDIITNESQKGVQFLGSLRDWFAGMALQGMMASECDGNGLMPLFNPGETWEIRTAERAYKFADAMLKERDNNQ